MMPSDRDHMFDEDDDAQRDEQEARIRELKRQAEATSGGEMLSVEYDHNGVPGSVREQFWATVLQYNTAPWTSEFEQLTRQGIDLPPPEQLDDAGVSKKIDEIARAMSQRNVFLENTDHLSDRQLYEHLYRETLHEAKQDVPLESSAFCSIDLVSSGGDQDVETYLRFYADDTEREGYRDFYPDGLPPRQPRPFDRDRHLPQPPDAPLIDDEIPIDREWLGDDTVR